MAKWYRGGASRGSPSVIAEGDTIEAQVYDDEGNEQGSILLGVRRLLAEHHGGHLIEAFFLRASDVYYHWWMNDGDGSPSKERGVYHLCTVAAKECPTVKGHKEAVHSDRYRCHGRGVLGSKQVPWLKDKVFFEGYMMALGAFNHALTAGGAKSRGALRDVDADVDWVDDVDPSEEGETSHQNSSGSESSEEDATMKDRIKELRKQLKQAEDDAADRKTKKAKHRRDKKTGEAREGKPKESRKKVVQDRDRGRKSKPPEPVEDDEPGRKKQDKKKKKRKRRQSSSDGAARGVRAGVKKKKRELGHPEESGADSSESQKEVFKVKKPTEHKEKDDDHDRGPFGGGPPVKFPGDEDDSSARGLSTSTKSSQQKLLAYTNKYPGRLASRMLLKMEHATASPHSRKGSRTPAVALNHILTILLPNLGVKAGVRSTRELKTLGTILDLLAVGSPSKAADVIAQRIKAVERASHESHWGSAQFLELLAPEKSMLLDKDEEIYVSKEYLLEQRLRQYDRGSYRPEGGGKGKTKGAKGKTKDKEKGDRGALDKNDKGGKKPEAK